MTDPRRFVRPTFVLIFSALVVYLIGNADVPLWDRDEPRYAQCSRQMLQSDDWVVPRLYDEWRTAKPPIIYWLQASSMSVFGDTDAAARFPSVIAMALTLLLIAIAVRKALGPEHAFWSVLVFGSCVMAVIAAKASLTDSVLVLLISIAQLCLYLIWRGRGTWPVVIALGFAIGLTIMTKGPVGLGIHAMTFVGYAFLTWSLKWKRFKADDADDLAGTTAVRPESTISPWRASAKSLVVVAIVAAIGLPWVMILEHRAPGFFRFMLGHEVGQRSVSGLEGHKGPPGYYLAAIWPIFLPWSLLLPATLVLAWKRRRTVYVRFALASVLGPWLMFEIVQTKLPHYLLPLMVPLSILTADAIVQCLRKGNAAMSDRGFKRGVVAWAIVLLLLVAMLCLAARWFTPQPWGALGLLGLFTLVYVVAVGRYFYRGKTQEGLTLMGLGGFLMYAILFRVYLPQCEYLQLSVKVANVLRENNVTERGQALMLDYKEPSLAFYQGGTIREHSATVLTTKLLESVPARWFVITREVWDASTPTKPDQIDPRPMLEVVATFRGLDIADGMRNVEVMVVKRKAP